MITVVVNCETLGVSEYALDWTDVAVVDGEVYGLTASALQRLTGPIEPGAAPTVATGEISLHPGQVHTVSRAYLDLESAHGLTLSAQATGDTRDWSVDYAIAGREGAGKARTISMARGPRGQDWVFRLASAAGGWVLKSLDVLPGRPVRRR